MTFVRKTSSSLTVGSPYVNLDPHHKFAVLVHCSSSVQLSINVWSLVQESGTVVFFIRQGSQIFRWKLFTRTVSSGEIYIRSNWACSCTALLHKRGLSCYVYFLGVSSGIFELFPYFSPSFLVFPCIFCYILLYSTRTLTSNLKAVNWLIFLRSNNRRQGLRGPEKLFRRKMETGNVCTQAARFSPERLIWPWFRLKF